MLIYKSFVDVSAGLSDEKYRLFWDAIHRFGIYGEDIPEFDDPHMNALMTLISPLIKANIKNYENGKKGGAPKGNNNAKKSQNEKTTQKQPGVDSGLNKKTTQKQGNVTVTVTDTVTATPTDTENVKEESSILEEGWIPYKDEHGNWVVAGEEG